MFRHTCVGEIRVAPKIKNDRYVFCPDTVERSSLSLPPLDKMRQDRDPKEPINKLFHSFRQICPYHVFRAKELWVRGEGQGRNGVAQKKHLDYVPPYMVVSRTLISRSHGSSWYIAFALPILLQGGGNCAFCVSTLHYHEFAGQKAKPPPEKNATSEYVFCEK